MSVSPDQCDEAVSPVVGMVLVLAISVLGISGVLVWGLPAINEMKAGVEHQAIVTAFHEFEADVKELSKATASKTAKVWRFSQSQGDFTVQAGTERWIVSLDGKGASTVYNITAYGLDNTDAKIVLVNNQLKPNPAAPAAGLQVNLKADFIDGAASVALKWHKLANVADPCPGTITQVTSAYLPWATGTPKVGGEAAFCLFDSASTPAPITLKGKLLQIQLLNTTSPTETVAYVWAEDVGRAQWRLTTEGGLREVYVSNGVVLHGSNGHLALDSDPSITPPSQAAGGWRFFGRLTTLNGTASLGGQARLDVLLNLYSTRTLADEAQGTAVKVWTYGHLEKTWDKYFRENDYDFSELTETAPGAPAGTKYMEFAPRDSAAKLLGLKLILHHSVVTAKG